jgi:hypothetical protein
MEISNSAADASAVAAVAVNGFDPRPLAALEEELAQRIRARARPISMASWEFATVAPAAPPPPPRFAIWARRGLIAAAGVGAVAGAVVLSRTEVRPAPAASRPVVVARGPTIAGAGLRAEMLLNPVRLPQALPAPADVQPAGAAAARALTTPSAPRSTSVPSHSDIATLGSSAELADQADQAAEAPPASSPLADRPRPDVDCSRPRSLAEEKVCADPRLIAADQTLGRALRRAEAAGVPDAGLRAQHERWAMARERAASQAPWALAQIYERRIEELRVETEQAEADRAVANRETPTP